MFAQGPWLREHPWFCRFLVGPERLGSGRADPQSRSRGGSLAVGEITVCAERVTFVLLSLLKVGFLTFHSAGTCLWGRPASGGSQYLPSAPRNDNVVERKEV